MYLVPPGGAFNVQAVKAAAAAAAQQFFFIRWHEVQIAYKIKGVIDPAARNRAQADGERLLATYKAQGLKLTPANNAVEAGIYEVWQRLSTGRLKFFRTLTNLQAEYRLYRRDENGKIKKDFDHLMDALRYLVMSGKAVASVQAAIRAAHTGSAPIDPIAGY
jgi:hypothetical protein